MKTSWFLKQVHVYMNKKCFKNAWFWQKNYKVDNFTDLYIIMHATVWVKDYVTNKYKATYILKEYVKIRLL